MEPSLNTFTDVNIDNRAHKNDIGSTLEIHMLHRAHSRCSYCASIEKKQIVTAKKLLQLIVNLVTHELK